MQLYNPDENVDFLSKAAMVPPNISAHKWGIRRKVALDNAYMIV